MTHIIMKEGSNMFYVTLVLFFVVLLFIFVPTNKHTEQSSSSINEYAIIEEQEDKRLDRELKARRYSIAQAKESRLCDHRGHRAGQRPRKTLRDKRKHIPTYKTLDLDQLREEVITS